ncbi:hypothetical protein F5X99DRAFT_411082 [Biscogniauxia marginata]|nr:hypothetical protein F5X99DRAFT_411082 [Biscogniauxia marginata]
MDHASKSPPPATPSSPPTTAIITRSPLSNRSNVELARWDYKDSSEGQPSPHDSLYDASRVSTSDRAKSPYQTAAAAVVRPVTPPPPLRPIDLDSESPLSRLETPFLYGHGTELAPILEQRSIATLRTASFSMSDVSSLMHGAPPSSSKIIDNNNNNNNNDDSDDGTLTTPLQRHHQQQRLRRRQSFSLDDLPLVYPSRDEQCEVGDVAEESRTGRPRLSALIYARPTVQVVDVHAYPQKPIYPAHQEPRTPPGLAALMEQEKHQQHQQQHQGGRSRSRSRSRDPRRERSSEAASASTSFDVPFRGPRSGHGNLASHPFMRRHGTSAVVSSSSGRPGVPTTTTTTAAGGSSPTSSSSRRPPGTQTAVTTEAQARARPPTPTPAPTLLRSRRTRSSTDTGGGGGAAASTSISPRPRAREQRESSHLSDVQQPPQQQQSQPSWTCRACHRPADEWWSLAQTVVGHGPGARRGDDWCARCAYRKVVHAWCRCCCGEGRGEKVYV